MAIVAYTGLPGSGKSYGVIKNVIIPAVEADRRIITNIPITDDFFVAYPSAQITQVTNDDIKTDNFWRLDEFSGAVVVLDEVWRLWPSGQKASNAPESHKSGLAEHRHRVGTDGYTTEICLITQDLQQLASWARALVETTYRSVQLSSVGLQTKFRIDIYEGPVTGPNPPESKRLRQIYGQYDLNICRYYKSHTMSQTGEGGIQSRADKRANIFKSPLIRYGIPTAITVFIIAVYSAYKSFELTYRSDTDTKPIQKPIINHPTAQNEPQHALQRSQLSTIWRLSGRFDNYYIISGRPGQALIIPIIDNRCIIDQDGPRCTIDDTLVTHYSGYNDPTDITNPLRAGISATATGAVEHRETVASAGAAPSK